MCACGGLGVGWKSLWDVRSHCSFGSGIFYAQGSSHCSVLLFETTGRLQAALCMTFSDHTLKVYATPSLPLHSVGRNCNNAYCRQKPLLYPGLCKTGIIVTVLQKRTLKFTEVRNIPRPHCRYLIEFALRSLWLSAAIPSCLPWEGMVDIGYIGTKQPPENNCALKDRGDKGHTVHSGSLKPQDWQLGRTGRCQILVGLLYSLPTRAWENSITVSELISSSGRWS